MHRLIEKLYAFYHATFVRVEYVPVQVDREVEVIREVPVEVVREIPAPAVDPLEHVKALTVFMKSQGVWKFSSGDVSVEFPLYGGEQQKAPSFIDDKAQQMAELKQRLAEVAEDETTNLTWST
jgi:hypothetical protein